MTCVTCKTGETAPGSATFTSSDAHATVVITRVPATVCRQCGEVYYDEDTTRRLHALASAAKASGAELVFCEYTTV